MKGKSSSKKPTGVPSRSGKRQEGISDGNARDSQEERSFSNWLRSEEGVENLKLFILGNTLVVFFVLSWPNIKETLDALYYSYVEYKEGL